MEAEMDLSEFMSLVRAADNHDGSWEVRVWFKDSTPEGDPMDITVNDCSSEYEAKERVFLYLLARVHENQEDDLLL